MSTRPTDAEVAAELDLLESMDTDLEAEDTYADGLTGSITALRDRMTPGQVTSMGNSMADVEFDSAMSAANWLLGLTPERPSAQFV